MQYQLLGRSGLRVSRICLGTMSFGKVGTDGIDAQQSATVFDAYAEAGGNFIDTADMYAAGESERIVSDLISKDRNHFVVATKFSQIVDRSSITITGNSRKAMHTAVENSLRRLKTDYLDLFYLHLWDGTTSVDEVMRGFEDLIRAGKVLYPGVSNIPAWIVSRAQTVAELRGLSPLVSLQIQYSLAARAAERDLLPMASSLGIAVTAWGALAGGILTGKYRPGIDAKTSRGAPVSDQVAQQAQEIGEIAKSVGASPAQLALAWLLRRNVIPVIGARTVAQLADNLGALDVAIDADSAARLDEIGRMPLGYPQELLASPFVDRQLFVNQRENVLMPDRIIS